MRVTRRGGLANSTLQDSGLLNFPSLAIQQIHRASRPPSKNKFKANGNEQEKIHPIPSPSFGPQSYSHKVSFHLARDSSLFSADSPANIETSSIDSPQDIPQFAVELLE
jgi:hypothetical protein